MLGCAAGIVVGKLIGASSKQVAAGCMVGAIGGYQYGDHVAGKKAEYANKEQYYQRVLQEAESVAKQSRQLNKQLANEIKALQSRERNIAAKINEQVRRNQELVKLKSEAKTALAKANAGVQSVEREIAIQRKVRREEGVEAPKTFIQVSDSKITALEQERRQLRLAQAQLKAMDRRRVY